MAPLAKRRKKVKRDVGSVAMGNGQNEGSDSPPPPPQPCYSAAENYWARVQPDVDGMLGGFGHLHTVDVKHSIGLLRRLQKHHAVGSERALDCGSGIGRVTKGTLLHVFEQVDMVDVTATFIDASAQYLGAALESRIGEKFVSGLQDFTPPPQRYDVIWVQWVAGYLSDDDFVAFMRRCRAGVRPHGAVVLKENVCSRRDADFDHDDSSYTRQGFQNISDRGNSRWSYWKKLICD